MATKGWSFGALTDALKSAAFVDAGKVSGTALLIDGYNRASVDGVLNNFSGFRAIGVEQNDVQLMSNGSRPSNGVTGELNFSWYSTSTKLQHLRGAGTDSLGFNIAWSGVKKIHYQASSNKVVVNGDVFTPGGGLVIGSQTTNDTNAVYSDWFRLSANSATSFALQHTGRQWNFTSYGGIYAPTPLNGGAGDAFIRAAVGAGGWDDWMSRAPMVQVDLQGTSASTGLKFTLWGTTEVAAISAAYAGGTVPTLEIRAGSSTLYLNNNTDNNTLTLSKGGFSTASGYNIVSGGIVYGGGGSSYMGTDGNIIGPLWGGALNAWLANQIASLNNNINNRYREVRFVNIRQVSQQNGNNPNSGGIFCGIGDFGANDGYGWVCDLQLFKDSVGWQQAGWQ